MTYEEAKDKITNMFINIVQKDGEAAKPFRVAIEALEKQIPKKPDKIGKIDNMFCHGAVGVCKCGNEVFSDENYCRVCGQALDWSAADE